MKKLLLTAAFLASGCGLVLAQGSGTEPPKPGDKPAAAAPAPTMSTAPTPAPMAPAPTAAKPGTESGTAPDTAGPAAIRNVPGSKKE